jgi:RHS repeat-associated protein
VQEGALPTTPAANLLTGLGLDEFFTRTDAAGLRAFLVDALGSAIALADGAGAVQTEYTYAPLGETTVSGAASGNPYQFTGRENDGTGLYYYRARYYHPTLSRFVSEDPLEFHGGDVNLYAYVGNNPIDYSDPLGLFGVFGPGFVNVRPDRPCRDRPPDYPEPSDYDPCPGPGPIPTGCKWLCRQVIKRLPGAGPVGSRIVCNVMCGLIEPRPLNCGAKPFPSSGP